VLARPPRAWLAEIATASSLAIAIDLALSTAHGYKLVRPMWPFPPPVLPTLQVVGIESAVMVLVCGGLLLAMRLASRPRSPWVRVLVASAVPVLGWRGLLGFETPVLAWAVLHAGAVSFVMTRRRTPRGPERRGVAVGIAGAGAVVFVALWLPSTELSEMKGPAARTSAAATAEAPNLLLIVLDTVRADRLQIYGSERDTMPFLSRIARRATLFEHAVAASSYTLPSHASLFTGLLSESHGARVANEGVSLDGLSLLGDPTLVAPLSPDATTLAELAREAGFATGAIAANLAYLSPAFGLDQGFDDYVVPTGRWSRWQPAGLAIARKLADGVLPSSAARWYRSRVTGQGRFYLLASEVNALALRWLEPRRQDRFFLFLNYMDAHAPYLPPPAYEDPDGASDASPVDAYDAELRYLDDQLALLFARLEAWELLDRTLVVIAGDHGESFGEHGETEHATGLHEHQIHVPLLVVRPGQRAPERVARTVHLADVLPTVAALLGIEAPGGLDGISLFAFERERAVTSHLGRYGGILARDAIYRGRYKLIRLEGDGATELYDLDVDPEERHDLSEERPEVVRALVAELDRVKRSARPRFDRSPARLDPETRERLSALGYAVEALRP
jgi:arylsulfatase A-like enzyme